MISALYVVITATIIIYLSLKVIKLRRIHKVSVGDGGIEELKLAISTQLNAIEYIPIALILLLVLELNDAHYLLIHVFGTAFILGRVIHARALLVNNLKQRVLGMQITFYVLMALTAINIIYLPYGKLIGQ